MKRFAALSIILLSAGFGACEKQPVSQLALLEPATEEPGGHAEEGEAYAPNAKIPAPADATPEQAPKYFQDKK